MKNSVSYGLQKKDNQFKNFCTNLNAQDENGITHFDFAVHMQLKIVSICMVITNLLGSLRQTCLLQYSVKAAASFLATSMSGEYKIRLSSTTKKKSVFKLSLLLLEGTYQPLASHIMAQKSH